jgi:uncharacterized protein (DUF2336 family)
MKTTQDISRDELWSCIDAPNWAARVKCAERVARLYCEEDLDAVARQEAEDALRRLCLDAEIVVRRLLAETLKAEAMLPRDIALSLAADKPEVACPFLAETPALDDKDLIALARDNPGPHRLAIAGRQNLSQAVSSALCRSEEPGVAAAVLANETARIGAATLRQLLERQPDIALANAIARRRLLPIGTGESRHIRHANGTCPTRIDWHIRNAQAR